MARYLYISSDLSRSGLFESNELAATTERHKMSLAVPPLGNGAADAALALAGDIDGAVLQLTLGFLNRAQLRVGGAVLRADKRFWIHWPAEDVVECVDSERLQSFRKHRSGIIALERIAPPIVNTLERWDRLRPGLRWIYRGTFPVQRDVILQDLEPMILRARPVGFERPLSHPSGIYLRTDFWSRIVSGGSYGHTCYVAKELAATAERFVCLLTQPYALLDTYGVRQVTMDPPPIVEGEDALVLAPAHYYPIVKAACLLLRPSFLYERLCLGNSVGAVLSLELQIPYIVEYNGSEISMQRSFDRERLHYEDVYLKTEELAFRQATLISVISEAVRDDLIGRGVDPAKILVNPNGADPDAYAPGMPEERRAIRQELGFDDSDRVVGFTGTFGGWHGVDVLADAIPRVCAADPRARFLLIGDGQHKRELDEKVTAAGLDGRVKRVGRVSQADGARFLKACDIFVSPHNSHMVDSRFFGSPTKIFEYMAVGAGIVASRLEQIGDVLSPALTPADLDRHDLTVRRERSVLCTPGSVDEFVAGVMGLIKQPDVSYALGRNARQAILEHYSWRHHVGRLWAHAEGLPARRALEAIDTGDSYKDQVQHQWNNNPVGSEHAENAPSHTLEYFREIERHRYGVYAPWMPEIMEFSAHAGEDVLEIGGGLGIDLAQFASRGARVTDVDLSAGHLALAEEHFRLRGLAGRFVHYDAETLPFPDARFDLVYSNGVLHHTPNTAAVVREIFRVLKPGGRVIVMMYAENSLHYWRNLVWAIGLKEGELLRHSMGDIMSRSVERSANDARPLVKVYTPARLRNLFRAFSNIEIVQRQMVPDELPVRLRRFLPAIERRLGWNLIIKATKPGSR